MGKRIVLFIVIVMVFSSWTSVTLASDRFERGMDWPKLESPITWGEKASALVVPEHATLLVAACVREMGTKRLAASFDKWRDFATLLRASVDPPTAKLGSVALGLAETSHIVDLLLSTAAAETNRPLGASAYFRRCERPARAAVANSWESLKALLSWAADAKDSPRAARSFAERLCRPESPHGLTAEPQAWAVISAQRLMAELTLPAGEGKKEDSLASWLASIPKGKEATDALDKLKPELVPGVTLERGLGVAIPDWYGDVEKIWSRRAKADGEGAWKASLAALKKKQRLAETSKPAVAEQWLARAAWQRLGRLDSATAIQDELPAVDYGKDGEAFLQAYLAVFLSGASVEWPAPPNGGLAVSVLGDPAVYRSLSRALAEIAPKDPRQAPSCLAPLNTFIAAATKVGFGKIEKLDALTMGPVIAAKLLQGAARPVGENEPQLWLAEGSWLQWAAGGERVATLKIGTKSWQARMPSGHVFFTTNPALSPSTRESER